jgi:Holliday junction resolvasome RuvABC endonuclease subunit
MRRTLGFDQSYTNSGFCVTDEAGSVLDFGTFKSAKAMDVYERAAQVAQFVIDTVAKHSVVHVNLEGLAFGIRGDATRDLAGLLFTIVIALRSKAPSVTMTVVPPTTLKKFATGTGKSDKAAMIASVPAAILETFTDAKYKKTTGLADVCDAYWLAKYNTLKQPA